MKNVITIIKYGLRKAFYYELALFLILFVSLGAEGILGSIIRDGDFSSITLFFEMWFVNSIEIMYSCFLFLFPCVIGGIVISYFEEIKKKNNLVIDLIVHSIGYIIGLLFVNIDYHSGFELYAYDYIAFGLVVLVTIIRRMLINRKRQIITA
jgi:hypothetical protein